MSRLISWKGKRTAPGPSYVRLGIQAAVAILIVVLLLVNLFTHVFMVVRYYGSSMSPYLADRQTLMIHKTDEVTQGDVVAFYYNNKVLVRRVIACGGSTVSLDVGGGVTVDGTNLNEPYVEDFSVGQCNLSFPFHVPLGQYFVMGDNREISMDSRLAEIGPVSADRIIGKVIFVF